MVLRFPFLPAFPGLTCRHRKSQGKGVRCKTLVQTNRARMTISTFQTIVGATLITTVANKLKGAATSKIAIHPPKNVLGGQVRTGQVFFPNNFNLNHDHLHYSRGA